MVFVFDIIRIIFIKRIGFFYRNRCVIAFFIAHANHFIKLFKFT